MAIHVFICEKCGFQITDTDTKTSHICPTCNIVMYWDLSGCGIKDGDFKPFFSPDLGVYIDSSKKLNDTLKKRGMVNLNESKEYRQKEQEMLEKARTLPSMRNK